MTDKISSEEIKDALTRSGYLLESRLEKVLRGNRFYVEANSAYFDSDTTKSRELDLFAMNGYGINLQNYEFLYSNLIIEAVNNPQPIAFITKESQIAPLYREDIKVAGLPVKVSDNGEWVYLPEFLGMDKYHHYCQGSIATQYCSFTQKKNESGKREWMASHEETHFNSFRTLSVAVEYYQDVLYKAWVKDANAINLEFYYPVVVVQGELLEVNPESEDIDIKTTNHIQFRRTSVIGSKEFNYQIDVITEQYLSTFLKMIENEMNTTVRLLVEHDTTLRSSIEKIVALASENRSYRELKSALSYHYQGES